MPSEAQFVVHQCAQFSADTKLPHDQGFKRILKCLEGTLEQGLIMKIYPEKGIEFYLHAYFTGRWNQ